MSNWNIRYTKDHLAKAKLKGKTSFAIGYEGFGRAEAFMWLDDDDATFLWLMAMEVNRGKTTAEAFAVAEAKVAAFDAAKADAVGP